MMNHRTTHRLLCSNSSARKIFHIIIRPPHSPDLASSSFWLFPTLKMGLKGTRFLTMEGIKLYAMTVTVALWKMKPSAGASNNGRIDGSNVLPLLPLGTQ
jgi:hypothetical protein